LEITSVASIGMVFRNVKPPISGAGFSLKVNHRVFQIFGSHFPLKLVSMKIWLCISLANAKFVSLRRIVKKSPKATLYQLGELWKPFVDQSGEFNNLNCYNICPKVFICFFVSLLIQSPLAAKYNQMQACN